MNRFKYFIAVISVFFASAVFAETDRTVEPADTAAVKDTVPSPDTDKLTPVKKVKANHLDLVLVLDQSGSMNGLEGDTIGGFNSMIKKQKENKVDTRVTTVLFNDRYSVLYDGIKLDDVPEMTKKDYVTSGMTALLDAIGLTITRIDAAKDVNAADHKVIFVILTDGMENYSKEYKKSQIKEMISTRQEKFGWDFLFLGANIDAVGEAESLGISGSNAVKYKNTAKGVHANYEAVADFAGEALAEPDAAARSNSWKDKVEQDK